MLEFKGYNIPNTVDELTIKQFDEVNYYENNTDLAPLEKWIEKFKLLGLPEEVFDDMTADDFKQLVKDWNSGFNNNIDKITEVEIDGYVYRTKETLGVKDISLIEKVWKSNVKEFASETCAILFKRDDLNRTEHYADAHIKHKKSLFKSQPCKLIIPYITDILEVITKSAENVTKELE